MVEISCTLCGKTVKIPPRRVKGFRYCSRECRAKGSSGERHYIHRRPDIYEFQKKRLNQYKGDWKKENNPNWGGGKSKLMSGYILIKCDSHPYVNKAGYVLEHRLVMEKHLGRILLPSEIVHHINGNVQDNRIENLMLFSNQAEHNKHHFSLGGRYGNCRD